MVETFKKLCQTFGAGALGGLVAMMVFLLLFNSGVIQGLSVAYHPGYCMTLRTSNHTAWFYEGVTLYGFFALVFMVPWISGSQLQQAGIAMLLPSAFQLLYVFYAKGDGLFGVGMGAFTFVFVLLFNFTWALVAVSFTSQGK